MKKHLIGLVGLVVTTSLLHAQTSRVIVRKPHVAGTDATISFGTLDDAKATAFGFTRVGDYATITVYEGPASAGGALTTSLAKAGLQGTIAGDLQSVHLVGHDIDIDTGVANPPFPATSLPAPALSGTIPTLFILALRSYPQPEWIADLISRDISIVEPLPPNAYIVRATSNQIAATVASAGYARNAWRVNPAMKTVATDTYPFTDADPYHSYEVEAYEDDATPSLQSLLDSVDKDGAAFVMARIGHRVHYGVQMTSIDIPSLALLDQVFAISPIGPAVLSGERQANLVAQPTFSGSNLILPATAASYTAFLVGKCYPSPNCITNFSNTHAALVDVGFDNDRYGVGVTTQAKNTGGSISATATSVVIGSPNGFPSTGTFVIREGTEEMLVTGGQGTITWTITRGYNGTTAATHTDNTAIVLATSQGNNGGSITAGATSIIVTGATGFPTSGNYIILEGAEEMLVTGGQGTTTWTITRGYNNTTAASHTDGTAITLAPHPDFNVGQVITQFGTTTFSQVRSSNDHETLYTDDDFTHGTVTTSLLGGTTAYSTRSDCGNYRYTLGLAPGLLVAVDKFDAYGLRPKEYFCEGAVHTGSVLPCVLMDALDKFNLSGWLPDIVNHSWNENASTSCSYTGTSQQLDLATRTGVGQQLQGSTVHPQLEVVAAGNTDEAACATVRAPATARNVLAVGATYGIAPSCTTWANNSGGGGGTFADTCKWDFVPSTQDGRAMPSFSAKGTASGQLKPDLVAPGAITTGPMSRERLTSPCATIPPTGTNGTIFCNTPLDSTTYCASPYVQYGLSAGTSWAAPVVSGAAAVVRKWYRLINGTDPSPAMTKAILIGGARDIAGGTIWAPNGSNTGLISAGTVNHIPSTTQGWGMVSFDKLLGPATSYFFWDQSTTRLFTGNQIIGPTTSIVDGTKETRITLVWTDPYKPTTSPSGTVYAALVNNLDLEAFVGTGNPYYYGNNFDANGHSIPNPGLVIFDSVNTVEEILIPANTYTTGTTISIYVEGNGIMGDAITPDGTTPRQDFALFGYNIH